MTQTENNSQKKRNIDPSTLNFNKIEGPDSQKMHDGQFKKNLHIKQSSEDIVRMVIPRGITIKSYGPNVHKNHLAEGTLVTVYCNNKNPDLLCQREYDELMNFVNAKLSVIRDNPYELNQLENQASTKIVTEIDSEEKADKAFNLVKEGKKIYGQL